MSRIDKLKEQHPVLGMSIIDLLAKADPTKSNKYLEFMVKMMKAIYGEDIIMIENIVTSFFGSANMEILHQFEVHCSANRIKKNDISKYTSFLDLNIEVIKAEEIVKLKELEKQTKKVFENDDWLVLIPLSYEAAEKYGAGTKWCITQTYHWQKYLIDYKIIFILNKNCDDKYAVSREVSSKTIIQAWLSDDTEISPMLLPLPFDVMSEVIKEINISETIQSLAKDLTKSNTPKDGTASANIFNPLALIGSTYNPCGEIYLEPTSDNYDAFMPWSDFSGRDNSATRIIRDLLGTYAR